MSAHKDGGGAFPAMLTFGPGESYQAGMSLRDYFAAQALCIAQSGPSRAFYPDELAARAYQIADAMLAERAK